MQLERSGVIGGITSLITGIETEKQDVIARLLEEKRRLQTRINQMSFTNDRDRDRRIVELSKQGLTKEKIAVSVGMSRQDVYKALERVNVNSVDRE